MTARKRKFTLLAILLSGLALGALVGSGGQPSLARFAIFGFPLLLISAAWDSVASEFTLVIERLPEGKLCLTYEVVNWWHRGLVQEQLSPEAHAVGRGKAVNFIDGERHIEILRACDTKYHLDYPALSQAMETFLHGSTDGRFELALTEKGEMGMLIPSLIFFAGYLGGLPCVFVFFR